MTQFDFCSPACMRKKAEISLWFCHSLSRHLLCPACYNEVPEEGQPPIIGTLYVQKWFAGNATELEVTVKKP